MLSAHVAIRKERGQRIRPCRTCNVERWTVPYEIGVPIQEVATCLKRVELGGSEIRSEDIYVYTAAIVPWVSLNVARREVWSQIWLLTALRIVAEQAFCCCAGLFGANPNALAAKPIVHA